MVMVVTEQRQVGEVGQSAFCPRDDVIDLEAVEDTAPRHHTEPDWVL